MQVGVTSSSNPIWLQERTRSRLPNSAKYDLTVRIPKREQLFVQSESSADRARTLAQTSTARTARLNQRRRLRETSPQFA